MSRKKKIIPVTDGISIREMFKGFTTQDHLDLLVDGNIERAEKGDYDASLSILTEFRDAITNDEILDFRYLEYLAKCFDQIIRGVKPERALGLEKPKHRPRNDNLADRNVKLATEVMRRIKDGWKRDPAILAVAQKHNCSKSLVSKAYDDPACKQAAENNLATTNFSSNGTRKKQVKK